MKHDIAPRVGRRARSIGLVDEAAALTWIGRWGYSSPKVIAALTSKGMVSKLMRSGFILAEKHQNKKNKAHYAIVLTKAGVSRALWLADCVRVDNTVAQIAVRRGFRMLLLDVMAAAPALGVVRSNDLNHDLKLQYYIAALIRAHGDKIGPAAFSMQIEATSMRTTRELERRVRRAGRRIADFEIRGQLLQPVNEQFGNFSLFLEFENSRKRSDEYDEILLDWNARIGNGSKSVFILCDTLELRNTWQALAWGREMVPVLEQDKAGRFVLDENGRRKPTGETKPLNLSKANFPIGVIDWPTVANFARSKREEFIESQAVDDYVSDESPRLQGHPSMKALLKSLARK